MARPSSPSPAEPGGEAPGGARDRPTGRPGGGDPVEIGLLDPRRRDDAVAVLARAFWPDPLFRFFSRGPIHEHRNLPVFFAGMFDDAWRHGQVWEAVDRTGRPVGSASWLGPGAMPRGPRREARIYSHVAGPLLNGRNRRRGVALLNEVDRRHPHEPHWYLVLLGVDPAWQHRGVGGRLIGPVLGRCDAEGMPAYLETQKPENVAFYRRFGFDVRDEIHLPGTPAVWLMWRPAPG